MNIEQRISLYEKLYQEEIQRGERLNSRLNIPLAVSVPIIGLLAFLFQHIPDGPSDLEFVFWAFCGFALVSLFIAFRLFFNVWYGEKNKFLPTAIEIDNYYLKLRSDYFSFPNSKKLRQQAFQQFMLESYKDYATTNALNNDNKSRQLSQITLCLMVAVIMSFAATIPYKMILNNQTKELVICPINANHHRHHQVLGQGMPEMKLQDQDQPIQQNPLPQNDSDK